MSLVGPDSQRIAEGREACIQSYRDEYQRVQVTAFKADKAEVNVAGHTAVATYNYSQSYEVGSEARTEDGRNILVFTKEAGQWLLTWKAVIG